MKTKSVIKKALIYLKDQSVDYTIPVMMLSCRALIKSRLTT